MTTHRAPADAEVGLMVHLSDIAPVVNVVPVDYKERISAAGNTAKGLLKVERIGGGLSAKGDEPRIAVDALTMLDADKPRSSHKLLADVTHKILALGEEAPVIRIPVELGGEDDGSSVVRFDSGDVESGPVRQWFGDDKVVAVRAIYRIVTRR